MFHPQVLLIQQELNNIIKKSEDGKLINELVDNDIGSNTYNLQRQSGNK